MSKQHNKDEQSKNNETACFSQLLADRNYYGSNDLRWCPVGQVFGQPAGDVALAALDFFSAGCRGRH